MTIETTREFQTSDGLAKLEGKLKSLLRAQESFSRKAAEISGCPDFVGLSVARAKMLKGLDSVLAKIFSPDGKTALLDPAKTSAEYMQTGICALAVECGALALDVAGDIVFGNMKYKKMVSKPVEPKIRDFYAALDILSAGIADAVMLQANAHTA